MTHAQHKQHLLKQRAHVHGHHRHAPGPARPLRPPPPRVARTAALKVWQGMEAPAQWRLVKEIAHGHRKFLGKRYSDVVSVGYGCHTAAALPGQRPPPCAAFRIKDTAGLGRGKPRKRVPAYLYTIVNQQGVTRLCAVPTEVLSERHTGEFELQGNGMVTAWAGGISVGGMPCCVVRLDDGPVYLLGCYHVFALADVMKDFPGAVEISLPARPGQIVGNLSPYFGGIQTDGDFFDAALADVIDPGTLARLMAEPVQDCRVVQGEEQLAMSCSIHTRRGIDVAADWVAVLRDFRAQAFNGDVYVFPAVVELKARQTLTANGDSGSPVFDDTGTIFQGMHIAGTDQGYAYFIPAYELLRAVNYGMTSDPFAMLQLAQI